jgi:hypothetical protein
MKRDVDPAEQERTRALGRLKSFLERRGAPRAQMTVIVAATGSAGFLFSFLLLQVGIRIMWLRYVLAIALAYGVFLLLVGAWLGLQRRKRAAREQARSRGSGLGDVLDLPSSGGSFGGQGGGGGGGGFRPGGGSFGGGGSSAGFAEGNPQIIPLVQGSPGGGDLAGNVAHAGVSGGGSHGCGFSLDLDGDDLVVILAVIAAIGAAIGASIYVIVSAPTLLAEILFDGALSTGLYRRLRVLDHHQWWEDALRRTWIPAVIVALFFGVAGYLMQRYAPEAASIGMVWQHMAHKGT